MEKVKNNITELIFILDRSGSMAGLEGDTVGGFNAMIQKQRGLTGQCYVSTVLFDDTSFVLHDRIPLESVPIMTQKDYAVGGCTALIDTLGDTLKHIADIHKYARAEDVPEHTLFVITTDGNENASRRFSSDEVKRMIERHKEADGWEFLFFGANIDAVQTAARYGIEEDRAANYDADSEGTEILFNTISDQINFLRDCGGIKPVKILKKPLKSNNHNTKSGKKQKGEN